MDAERGLRYRRVQQAPKHLPGSRVAGFPPKLHIGRFTRRRPRTSNLPSTVLWQLACLRGISPTPCGQVNWFVWGHPRVLSLGVEPVLAPPPPSKGARSDKSCARDQNGPQELGRARPTRLGHSFTKLAESRARGDGLGKRPLSLPPHRTRARAKLSSRRGVWS